MIKNYTSGKNTRTEGMKYTLDKIQKILIEHNAKSINFEYKDGRVVGIIFVLEVKGKDFGFKIPARVENVKRIFDKQGYRYDPDQPYRTAWANIRDWVDAQMALIESEQAKTEEVFLPYMIVDGKTKTLFESYEDSGFAKLTSGPIEGEIIT